MAHLGGWSRGVTGARRGSEEEERGEGAAFDLLFNKPSPSLSPCAVCFPPAPGWGSRI